MEKHSEAKIWKGKAKPKPRNGDLNAVYFYSVARSWFTTNE